VLQVRIRQPATLPGPRSGRQRPFAWRAQTQMDEAIAIVMAPRDAGKRCGLFRLSTPGGLKLVQKCAQRGFHAHPPTPTGQPLYELCGHVYLNAALKHDVVDLR